MMLDSFHFFHTGPASHTSTLANKEPVKVDPNEKQNDSLSTDIKYNSKMESGYFLLHRFIKTAIHYP